MMALRWNDGMLDILQQNCKCYVWRPTIEEVFVSFESILDFDVEVCVSVVTKIFCLRFLKGLFFLQRLVGSMYRG